jgi:Septin family protein
MQIMEDIEHYDIPVYNFPYDVEEDDEETIQDNSELRVSLNSNKDYAIFLSLFDTGSSPFCDHWLGRRN